MCKSIQNRIFFIVSISLLLTTECSSYASTVNQTTDSKSIEQNLSSLEDRFFEHNYPKESQTDRLNRLEKFVFGSTQAGSVNERLDNLLKTVPAETANNTSNKTQNTANKPGKKSSTSSANTQPFDSTSYPRVNALEQQLLGQTYLNDPLSDRLSRLETKAFGQPSESTDLAQRVDSLDEYADNHDLYGERSLSTNAPSTDKFGSTALGAPSPTASVGSAQQLVSIMEQQVFHRTYPDRSLVSRVKKLDNKVLGEHKEIKLSLTQNINKLWSTLHPSQNNSWSSASSYNDQTVSPDTYSSSNPSLGSNSNNNYNSSNNYSPTNNYKPHHSWLHKLASTTGAIAKGAATMMMYSGYGYGMGGYGMGGYGMSPFGMGSSYYGMSGYPYGMGYGNSFGTMGYGMYSPYGGQYW